MDLARPAGIVMHASLANMIPTNFLELFEISSVYARGIDENQPVPVYFLKGATLIPESATSPPPMPWGEKSTKWTVADVKKLPGRYIIDVPNVVKKTKDVSIRFYNPGSFKGLRQINYVTQFVVRKVAGQTEIVMETKALKSAVEKLGDDNKVELEVKYRQK
jgi:hypothetical protein